MGQTSITKIPTSVLIVLLSGDVGVFVCVHCRLITFVIGISGVSLMRQWFRGGPRYTMPAAHVEFQRRKC
jgi:hypothetical protein